MGQIIGGAAKPKRCNIQSLSSLDTPAAGEYILVSSDNSMNAAGQGNFDCYIEGDGRTAATALELKSIADGTIEENVLDGVSGDTVYRMMRSYPDIPNLFNKDTITDGYYMNGASPASNSNFFVSDYIQVKPSTTYTFSAGLEFISYYNSSKGYINRLVSGASITTTASTYYIRISGKKTSGVTADTLMIVEGDTMPTNYIPYGYDEEKYVQVSKIVNEVKKGNVNPISSDGVAKATSYGFKLLDKNYDETDCVTAGNIGANGTVSQTSYYVSDFLEIPSEASRMDVSGIMLVSGTTWWGLCLYNSKKQAVYLPLADNNQNLPSTYILANYPDAKYIRFSRTKTSTSASVIFYEGKTASEAFADVYSFLDENSYSTEEIANAVTKIPYTNGYIKTNGKFVSSSGTWRTSTYLDTKYYSIKYAEMYYNAGGVAQFAFYDENKQYISCWSNNGSPYIYNEPQIPSNAKYFRFVYSSDYGSGFEAYNITLVKKTPMGEKTNELNVTDAELQEQLYSLNNMVKSVLFVGDSVTEGDIREPLVDGGTTYLGGGHIPYSYPTRLNAMVPNWDVTNGGHCGWSCTGWFNNGFSFDYPYSTADMIIIELGWNDSLSGNFASDVEAHGTDWRSYNTSAIGYYCKIIGKFMELNPNAFIILVCSAGWSSTLVNKVKTVAEFFDVPYIDLTEGKYFVLAPDGGDNIHFSSYGYYKKALYMNRAINDCIQDNIDTLRIKLYNRMIDNSQSN